MTLALESSGREMPRVHRRTCREASPRRRAVLALAGAVGAGLLGYAAYAATAWYSYGRRHAAAGPPGDLLERFMPAYEVSERHAIDVAAPASETFAAARAMDVNRAPLARAIFAARSLPARLRGASVRRVPRSLLDETQAIGWRVLAEVPGRAIVMGAYTQPWKADVEFHGLPAAEFAAFSEPGFAKIVWTLEVEPLGPARSRFVTRTRVHTTDASARRRFRRYWALMSPGILLIRHSSLGIVKREAERRSASWRAGAGVPESRGRAQSTMSSHSYSAVSTLPLQ